MEELVVHPWWCRSEDDEKHVACEGLMMDIVVRYEMSTAMLMTIPIETRFEVKELHEIKELVGDSFKLLGLSLDGAGAVLVVEFSISLS
ncbi:hypothetical protein TorRG33x02_104940 [Trema orientale]|uniref:Uncharacterized protein n=1 Tax=Trema orientale TaxID=63057 RepID=A0A2P5F7P2_TREOI|nr:hypothetical protein TorRG33x02_104940 [Trema orientale]